MGDPIEVDDVNVKLFDNQDFDKIREALVAEKRLFEDPEFPLTEDILTEKSAHHLSGKKEGIEWLRPQEICERQKLGKAPKFTVNDVDRFDVKQGELGNCWFLAATASLAESKSKFRQVVPRHQRFSRNYAGIFKFRIWSIGKWIEIVVDDRLPTRGGHLIYQRSGEPNEFWSALLEKAYAKLYGSYRALEGGSTLEAAVDFTGGIPEVIAMDKIEQELLFRIMTILAGRGAFMGSALKSEHVEDAASKGLMSAHAYTITKIVQLENGTKLVRIRNPHGNDEEWKGDWADGDKKWDAVPVKTREELALNFRGDGEFYMCEADFTRYYGNLEVCHLSPESADIDDGGNAESFGLSNFVGKWKKGESAGGCGNDGMNYFATNPQYFFRISEPDPRHPEGKCSVIVSLSQKLIKRKSELAIGFKIYKCHEEKGAVVDKFTEDLLKRHKSVATSDSYINRRDVSQRFRFEVGHYCVIPSTFQRDLEADFLLRVFVEK